jgi:hypothetical protein
MEHPGYDLYFPGSAAAQLGISLSFFRESVKKDPKAPLIDCLQYTGVAEMVGW